MGKMSAN